MEVIGIWVAVIVFGGAFAIGVLTILGRMIFRVDERTKNQEKIIALLQAIAPKSEEKKP